MHPILSKTLGGLDNQYHFRQFVFGLIFPIVFYYFFLERNAEVSIAMIAFAIVSTLLYPYSRFIYEKVMGFIFGENVFFVNAIIFLPAKFLTMYLCWGFAMVIAPVGLGYLYFYHTKNEANKQGQPDA